MEQSISPSSSSSSSSKHSQKQQQQQQVTTRTRSDSFFGIDRSSPPPQQEINSNNKHFRPSSFYGLNQQQQQPIHHLQSPSPSPTPSSSSSSSPLSINQLRQTRRLTSTLHPIDTSSHFNALPIINPPLLDHSHLKPGQNAKLLNHAKTLELYRANAKKTNDPEVMFEFSCFLMDLVKEMNQDDDEDMRSLDGHTDPVDIHRRRSTFDPSPKSSSNGSHNPEREKEKASLIQEAIFLLQKLANRGHVQSQFLLADCYTKAMGTGGSNLGTLQPDLTPTTNPTVRKTSKPDYDRAFPLFVLAAKHGHVEAMFRAGQCCEHGWGTRRERDKALQFYRKAAIAQHPLAMYRLGLADLNGDLGTPRRPKDGVKWLKRAAELADSAHPNPLHELALLHERGLEHVVFVDYDYAVELLARAAELGYAPSAYKLGECYEYGRMGCPQDAALSIHYYNIAAQQNHKEACFALTAWYLVGSPGVLPQSDTEAYLWAKKAAEAGLSKAEYAVGYFTEVGVGTTRNEREALRWFMSAAEHGDKRAKDRLKNVIGRAENPTTTETHHNQVKSKKNIKLNSKRMSIVPNQTSQTNENNLMHNTGSSGGKGDGVVLIHHHMVSNDIPHTNKDHTNPLVSNSVESAHQKKGKEDCIIV